MGCWGYFLDDPLKRTEPIIPGTAEKNDRIRSTVTLEKKLIIIRCAFLKSNFFLKWVLNPLEPLCFLKWDMDKPSKSAACRAFLPKMSHLPTSKPALARGGSVCPVLSVTLYIYIII